MIYLVSNQTKPLCDEHSICSVEDSLLYLSNLSSISVDIETSGLNCHLSNIISLQLGNFNNQYVIDCSNINILLYKELLESDKLFIFQNAKFDLQFLYKHKIFVRNVYDTFLVENIMTAGKEKQELNLKALGLKYCNVELDKSVREMIHRVGLNTQVIIYGANDIKYLEQIMKLQIKEIEFLELERVVKLENDVVKVFALMEFNGIPFNPEKWLNASALVEQNILLIEDKLDETIANSPLNIYKNQYKLGNLFFEERHRKSTINWKSNKQKLQVLNLLGLKITDVGEKTLQKNKKKNEICTLLLEYSKQSKLATSFGRDFVKFINPKTNKIHPNYYQILSTGRISVNSPNINQIPSHGEIAIQLRSAFEAPKGYKIVGGDYSGMELRITAQLSKDPLWINTFLNNKDLHSELCAKTFNIPIEDVKKPFPLKPLLKYRDIQKTINFG